MSLENNGRSVGKQAAMIARVTSRKDHVAASTLSQLGSLVDAAVFNVRIRTIEVIQVLIMLVLVCKKNGDDIQESHAENCKKHSLLPLWKLQTPDDRQRKTEHENVSD